MMTEHPQKEIIDALMENSDGFRKFSSEYGKTLDELRIRWFENPSIINGQCTPLENKTFIIQLNQIPPQNEAAFVVAHELYHAILFHLRYPLLRAPKRYNCRRIMDPLTTMVYDHHINFKIRDMFDNGCKLIKIRAQRFFEDKLQGHGNIDDKSKLETLFIYVNFQLNFEILCDTTDFPDSNFFKWFASYRSDIISESSDLISQIRYTEFNAPENVEKLFKEIIRQYLSLEPIEVVYF
jgi:hypothetical protein